MLHIFKIFVLNRILLIKSLMMTLIFTKDWHLALKNMTSKFIIYYSSMVSSSAFILKLNIKIWCYQWQISVSFAENTHIHTRTDLFIYLYTCDHSRKYSIEMHFKFITCFRTHFKKKKCFLCVKVLFRSIICVSFLENKYIWITVYLIFHSFVNLERNSANWKGSYNKLCRPIEKKSNSPLKWIIQFFFPTITATTTESFV